jgi:hypothetical protein
MNHISSEDQRDTHAGFRYRYFLDFIDKLDKDPLLEIVAGRSMLLLGNFYPFWPL